MATLNFDAHQVDPAAGRDPIPAGKYLVAITSSEMKPTRNGAGQYLEFEYQVLEGEHKGRRVWSRHTLQHPSDQTVQIARGELSAICRAVGVMTPRDSAELHNLPLQVTVRVKNREDNNEPTNEVSGWAKKEASSLPQQAGAAGGPPKPSWMRRS
ncbi:MAG: DUF669 domain-containing protein [Planctomycetota bacterium]